MGSLFEISILISLFAIVNGNVVIDELKDKQTSVDSALKFMKIGLQEFSEGIEQMVMKRLEGVETIVDEKIKQMIGNATRSIIEEQSTDQKKTSENLLSTFQTEQRQKIESPTRYVDKKISDQLFTTQIEQRLFRQELISVTASLFGKLERISDVLSKTQNEQQILNQKIMSLSTNFSETVDQKIIDLTSTAQTERQQQLRQNIEFLAINLTKAIEGKLSDVLWTTQTEQPLLCRKIEYFTTNLTENIKEKIIDVLSTTHTEQQVLNKKIESLLTNFSENVDKKVSDKLSSIQTEQHILKQEVFSLTANLVGKIEGIRNTSMYVAEQLSSGEALNMIRNVENISQFLLKVHVIAGSDCADILEKYPKTRWENGVYYITASSYKTKAVFCDMTTNNGGWTVIQRRVNGSVDFYRNWTEYKNGFGFADHEYWIGNDMLHKLTSLKTQELRVDMERFNGEKAYAVYSRFYVGDETSKYKLEVQGYSGNAGIGGTQTDMVISTNFVAMPTPQNRTSLQSTACNVSGGFVKYSETINTFLPGQDFFYTQQHFDKTTKDFFRVSTAQCYQYPEIFFVLSTLLTECRMIRKKSYDTKNDLADRNATNIYVWLTFYEMDCTGVPFAKHLCVTCKSKDCSANVTCYVFAGECTGSLELNTNLIDDKVENGKSCKHGSKDGNCTNICDPGTYGLLCSSRCSRHCVDGECHHRNGTCLQGCTSGWKGDKCTEPDCPPGKYGVNCSLTCSPNCWSGKCDSEDGTCVCGLGWQRKDSSSNDVLCNKPCESGFYGYRCEEECGDCLEGTVCLPGNGTCPKGCNEPGFRISSDRCNYNQYDSYKSPCYHDEYGINCEKTCNPTCLRNSCRNTDGRCRNCPAGLKGFNCTTECSPGTFGENCNGRCRCDGGSPCDPVSGRCPGECEEGYEGETCSMKKCEPGLYGDDCDKWCFCKDRKPCDRRYGYCPEKECQKGWSLSSCDYRDTCLYTETAGPITWEPRSLGIGLALGFVGTFFVTGCGGIYRKFEKM